MSQIQRRKFLKRAGQTAGLIIAGGSIKSLLVACGGNVATTPESTSQTAQVPSTGLMTPGSLQWGGESTSGAPYVFQDPTDPNQLVGFEVEIADALAKLMGVKQAFVQTAYGQLPAALASDKFDFIMNGWEINDDRAKTQIFSVPYYHYGQQIVVRADDPRFKDYTETSDLTLKNLAGMTVGTGSGYKAEDLLRADKALTTKAYDGNLPFDDLTQKKVDAVFLDFPIVAYFVLGSGPGGTTNDKLRLIGKPFELSDYVVAFHKSSPRATALQKEIDQAFGILKKDGTLKGIYEKWKMWNAQQADIGIV
ncbi:MAG: ABC transporter substrate-binding protein [Aphanocapsa sp. GSE-SYN-MK-11-07L]|jgi:polar amino acid transport system substrate-binding protein|nr:ABC transporter substrate-binding protein [Aphanocapsa sp. GSE-SYN-MK-11-07L]